MKIRIINNKGEKIKRLKPTDRQARGEEKKILKYLNLREARGEDSVPTNKTINHTRESCKQIFERWTIKKYTRLLNYRQYEIIGETMDSEGAILSEKTTTTEY